MGVEQKLRLDLWLRYWAGLRLAPHVGTPAHIAHRMLKLAAVRPSDCVFDLGCGDARLLIAGQFSVLPRSTVPFSSFASSIFLRQFCEDLFR